MEENKPAINEFAIASLIIGILSFINLAGMEKAILAIVFGFLALKKANKDSQVTGKNFATAGIVLGIFAIVASTIFIMRILPVVNEQLKQMQGAESSASKLY